MRVATGPPGGLRQGIGFTPTSPGGLSKNSLQEYTSARNKSNRRAALVSVDCALPASSWNWLRWLCGAREKR
jgi:hypothetical protein